MDQGTHAQTERSAALSHEQENRKRIEALDRRVLRVRPDAFQNQQAELLLLQYAIALDEHDAVRIASNEERYAALLASCEDGSQEQQLMKAFKAARHVVANEHQYRLNNAVLFSEPGKIQEEALVAFEEPFVYELMRHMCQHESRWAILAEEARSS
jgi:hypothetical protein